VAPIAFVAEAVAVAVAVPVDVDVDVEESVLGVEDTAPGAT
jgi:hypothetical protein